MGLKILVTGGSGFIGSHVVDTLIEAGHTVTVSDHRVRPHRQDVEFEDVDLLDLSSVLVATRGMDQIFHLGAVSNADYAHKYPVYSTALNVMGTTNVLEAARINGVRRVHLASTVWVYNGAPNGVVADESVPFHLNGAGHIYTSTKMASEMLCHNYGSLYDVPFTVLRYGIPYGPRMREELLIPIFLRKALNGEPLTIAGEGKQYRKFLYVKDLAAAHALAVGDAAANEIYNLEGLRPVTVLQVAEGIKKLVGNHVKIDFVPERPGDFGGKQVSGAKAAERLGWIPVVEFEEGLKRTAEWFAEKWNRPLRRREYAHRRANAGGPRASGGVAALRARDSGEG